jgi:hypothetical protein
MWGYSFHQRVSSLNQNEADHFKSWNIPKDPRLTFLNFDFIKTSNGEITQILLFPMNGLLKFIKAYIDLAMEVHLFRDIDSNDVTRRSLDALHLATDSEGVFGFISWINIILKDVINVFTVNQLKNEIGVSHLQPHLSNDVHETGGEVCDAPLKSFENLENDWFRSFGDINPDQFDNQCFHGLMSIVLYEIWAIIYGVEPDFESKKWQSKKMSDKTAFIARKRDIDNLAGFCRPCWITPISFKHFTEPSHFLSVLATSCVLEESVPLDWDEGYESNASILGAFTKTSGFGYPASCANLRPSADDIKEGLMFERLVELLIQKLHFSSKKDGEFLELSSCDVLAFIMENPGSVHDQLQEFFLEESLMFASCLSKLNLHSWPNILVRARNYEAAVMLIQRKITHWNIISVFDRSNPSFDDLKLKFSRTQFPIIRRCFVFALVHNWGGWNGLGREIRFSQLNDMLVAVGNVLTDICQISIELFPTFLQRLFTMFEAPKIGSALASEFQATGSLFLKMYGTFEKHQSSAIVSICNSLENIASIPKTRLKYLRHVGDCLFKRDPTTWSFMDSFAKVNLLTGGISQQASTGTQSASHKMTYELSSDPIDTITEKALEMSPQLVLDLAPVKQIVQSTLENNSKELLFRFLGIDTQGTRSGRNGSSFFGVSSIANSTDRDLFPQHLHKMVYNVIGVIGSRNRLIRGPETNALILSSLTTIVQIIYAGACVSLPECEYQLSKLSKNKPVLDQQDTKSLFARVNHLQECLVGLRWCSSHQIDNRQQKAQHDSSEIHQNPVLVTDSSMKVALRTIQFIAQLTTLSSPTPEIRIEALRALICILDSCSVAVLDQFFGDTQVIQSTANIFAVTLAQNFREYEVFSDRDDILVLGLKEFQGFHKTGDVQDEFVRQLISIELEHSTSSDQGNVSICIRETYNKFGCAGYDLCMHSLRLIEKMCVLSGKATRAPYFPGQFFLEMQPNSDPAMVVSFQVVLISLGSKIASRFRIGGANVFDIRVLHRIFKVLNSITFGQSPAKIKSFFVADTYVLVNKTVAGLSQRIDDIEAHYFPEIHPIHVFEGLLKFLMALVLSDIDGTCCKALGKGVSWINVFSLVSQVHSASLKFLKNTGVVADWAQSRISAHEYRAVSIRIGDAAYILFSSMKRQDIVKGVQLEKDWIRANLQTVAMDASKRVSCVEIVRYPGFPELCFFQNPQALDFVSDNTQRTLLCVEESRQLSLRKNLVLCERMRVSTNATTSVGPKFLKQMRNMPLLLTTLINFLLLGWLNLPVDFSQSESGWKWPQEKMSWENLFPKNGTYSYEVFQDEILPNILPLFITDDSPNGIIHKRAVNMTFLVLTVCVFYVIFFARGLDS